MLSDNKQRNKTVKNESEVITPEIILQLRNGNQEAFKTIYLHYYNSVKNFLYSLLQSKDESEEMTQDVFMMLWEKRETIDPSKNIKSLVYTIARNAAMNFFDHQKVIDRFSRTVLPDELDNNTSEEILIAQETELIIKLVIANMPEKRRTVFEMSYYKNMDNETIASTMGISKFNVANHLAHARRDIKKAISLFLLFMVY